MNGSVAYLDESIEQPKKKKGVNFQEFEPVTEHQMKVAEVPIEVI